MTVEATHLPLTTKTMTWTWDEKLGHYRSEGGEHDFVLWPLCHGNGEIWKWNLTRGHVEVYSGTKARCLEAAEEYTPPAST